MGNNYLEHQTIYRNFIHNITHAVQKYKIKADKNYQFIIHLHLEFLSCWSMEAWTRSKHHCIITQQSFSSCFLFQSVYQGRIQDFHLKGRGAQKDIFQHEHYKRGNELTFGGVQGPLKGPGSSGVILMLSRVIWALLFKHSDKRIGKKHTHSLSNFKGAPVAPPPLDPPLFITISDIHFLHNKWRKLVDSCFIY